MPYIINSFSAFFLSLREMTRCSPENRIRCVVFTAYDNVPLVPTISTPTSEHCHTYYVFITRNGLQIPSDMLLLQLELRTIILRCCFPDNVLLTLPQTRIDFPLVASKNRLWEAIYVLAMCHVWPRDKGLELKLSCDLQQSRRRDNAGLPKLSL